MPDIFYLFSKWWKQIAGVIVFSVAVVGTIVFLQPSMYSSVATALPGSRILTDKARIFNKNIEALYPTMGNGDELDVILGTAQLDTVYLALAAVYHLPDHYKIKGEQTDLINKAADVFKKNTRVFKSEYNELKVQVWDEDKNLAPQLANAVMEKLNAIHQAIRTEDNQVILKKLLAEKEQMQAKADSIRATSPVGEASTAQLLEYGKLADEYRLIVDANPPVLMVVEQARPSSRPNKPQRLMILAVTAFLSFLFALMLALVLERRKNPAR